MSKKKVKTSRVQPSAKARPKSYNPSWWTAHSATSSAEDPLLKKIFYALLALIFILMVLMALSSGINGDDEYQNDYSSRLVKYYTTMGADTSALYIEKGKMHYYGGLFDIISGFTNKILGYEIADTGYHKVRHFYNAVFGMLILLFTSLMAKEIAGWRAAILTLLILFLSPRLTGHALMNPKDIPFATGHSIALYYMVMFIRNMPVPNWRYALGIAAGVAIAIATRAGGMLLIGYLFLFASVDFLAKNGLSNLGSNLKLATKYGLWCVGISVVGFSLALLFWPYALQSPLKHPFEALGEFSKLGVKIRVLFGGENLMSDQTPWYYPLQWIWRTIPLMSLFGFAGGLLVLPAFFRRYPPLPVLMAFFVSVFPLAFVIYKDSILHDGWRHLLFVYPTMALVAALFMIFLHEKLPNGKLSRYVFYSFVVILMAEAAVFMARNTHVPYVYFNPLSGGIKGNFGHYETDYWGVSMKPAIEWLESQGILRPDMQDTITIATSFSYTAHAYLDKKYGDKVKVKYTRFNNRYETDWDYGIFPSRYIKGPHLRSGTWPNKRSIHAITANGVPLTAIEKGGGAVFEAEKLFKSQNWAASAEAFEREVRDYPDNELAWMKLAICYANLGNFSQARNAADQMLKLAPDNTSGLLYRGLAAMNLGDIQAAEADFRRTIQVENDFSTGYYYLAVIANERNDISGALENVKKAIEFSPRFKAAYELAAQIYEKQGDSQSATRFRSAAGQL